MSIFDTVLDKLREAGLGKEVDSWISVGQNLPISPRDLVPALGQGPLGDLARQFGIDPQQAAAKLAELLPETIDKMTPDGRWPDEHAVASALEKVKQRLGV